MSINQLSIFIENKQGALARITDILAGHSVDIRAMSLAETQNFGVLRLIVSDTEAAAAALAEHNTVFHLTKVLAAAVPDKPGGLASILKILSDNNIDIMYMYAFLAVSRSHATVVLRISSSKRDSAAAILASFGVRILGEEDIRKL